MASRGGNVVQLRMDPDEKKRRDKKAEWMREYRKRTKEENAEKYSSELKRAQIRNKRNRQRERTEDEKAHECELARRRAARYREKKRSKSKVQPLATNSPKPQRKTTRKAAAEKEVKRKEWREKQAQSRMKWSAQKQRRHREKALAYYHQHKTLKGSRAKASQTVEKAPDRADLPATPTVPTTPDLPTAPTPQSLSTPQTKLYNKKTAKLIKDQIFANIDPNHIGRFLKSVLQDSRTSPRKQASVSKSLNLSPSPVHKIVKRKLSEVKRHNSKSQSGKKAI